MGDEPPLRRNPVPNDSDEILERGPPSKPVGKRALLTTTEPSSHRPLPMATSHAGQLPNMEFEPYSGQHFNPGHFPAGRALDMSNMVSTLPDYQMQQYQQQSFPQHYQPPGTVNQSMVYPYHQGAQFAGQAANGYNLPFAQQYPSQFMQGHQQHGPYPHFIGNPGGPGGPPNFQNPAFMLQQPMLHNPNATPPHQQSMPAQYPQSHGNPAYVGAYAARVSSAYPFPQLRVDNSITQPPAPSPYDYPNPQGT